MLRRRLQPVPGASCAEPGVGRLTAAAAAEEPRGVQRSCAEASGFPLCAANGGVFGLVPVMPALRARPRPLLPGLCRAGRTGWATPSSAHPASLDEAR